MTVVFAERSTGRRIEKYFESYYLGMKFMNKVKRSKKLLLISWWKN